MKKILKYSLLAVLGVVLAANTGCKKSELDTNQFQGYNVAAIAPNPVMRGGELHIVGGGLENTKEVQFAGGVTVTDIKVIVTGAKSEILVMVPLEGPEVGKVTVVGKDGRVSSTKFDLTFTEPIVIDTFSPDVVVSGDILTFKGEYLNDVKTVIFSGDVMVNEFVSQSRHELSVKVPANALSGPVIVSDVDEITDETTIPNHIYTPYDLGIGTPVVNAFEDPQTIKAGQVVEVSGNHLDMIKTVSMPNVEEIDFEVNEAHTKLTFVMPAKALSGSLLVATYDGDEFEVGEIDVEVVKDLTLKVTSSDDDRFKGGYEVEISGTNLDLVTKVEFGGNVEAEFYMVDDVLITHVPFAAKDGPVTVTMESGAQAFSEDIEVVKPIIDGWLSGGVAGKSENVIEGIDLDLVTSAKMGTKEQGFIDCEFTIKYFEEVDDFCVVVKLPREAYTSPIILASAAGYETQTDDIYVRYEEAVNIKFTSPSYASGQNITVTGENLLKIEQIYIKGKKVIDYYQHTDEALAFAIPDKLGPGVYRLDLVLTDGTTLTWPFPFEITAPYTETFIWEGSETINWTGMGALSWGGYDWSTVEAGTVLCAHFTVDESADYWQIRFGNGSWASLPSLAGLAPDGNIPLEPGMTEYKFELSAADLDVLVNQGGLVMTGANYTITGVSLITYGAAEKRTTIWEGSSTVTWGGGAVTDLSWGGYDWTTVEPGTKLSLVYTIDDPDGCIRVGNGSWASIPSLAGLAPDGNLPLTDGGLTVELTAQDVDFLINNGGLVICGTGYTITEIALVTTEGGKTEQVIWEGSSTVTWGGGAVTDLSWGGYDWTTVEAGTILCVHYNIDDPEGCIRIGNGSWASIPSLAGLAPDGNLPLQDGGHEVELTAEDVDFLINNGGLVVCGTGYTITQIGLK